MKDFGIENNYQDYGSSILITRKFYILFGKKVSEDDEIIKHCLNVSALVAKFAAKLKMTEKEQDDLATAGLVHEIGVTALNDAERKLFHKPRKQFTAEDKRLYWAHVKKGADLLS